MSDDTTIRVLKGTPTDVELAALVVVLTSLSGSGRATAPTPTRSGWSAYAHAVRAPLARGPHAWRMSAR